MSLGTEDRVAVAGQPLRPESCAAVSAALGEPLPGTAPVAQAWLAVEVPGTWSSKVLADPVRPWLAPLEAQAKAYGVSVIAIRRPGRVGRVGESGHRALLACTLPGRSVAGELQVSGPSELAELDLAQLAAGVLPAGVTPVSRNAMLVCTNSKRDACCAVAGRALADALDRARPGQVWECSHLGGHRFAPTALVLPTGYAYARLTVPAALRLLDAEPTAEPELELCRGRSTWDRQGQVAEIAARRLLAASGTHVDADGLTVETTGQGERLVLAPDGVRVPVHVEEHPADPARSISCGAEPVSPPVLVASGVGPVSTPA